MGPIIFLLAVLGGSTAEAGTLDMTLTSSTGCDAQWVGDCLPNPVWGSDDVLHVETSTTHPFLTIGASSAHPTRIGIVSETLGASDDRIHYVVKGKALSAATKVIVETRFFDVYGVIIQTNSKQFHGGSASRFSVSWTGLTLPAGAVTFKTRLLIDDGPALITHVQSDSGAPDGGDTGGGGGDPEEGECTECSVPCDGYTGLGQLCPPDACDATCDGVFGEGEFKANAGVTLSP